ncbi:MAG: hypothetical protein HGA45_15025 [Chloroflexales bacterium]|nr:hypothetical protein [Chloroflexales bacterium]
MEQYEIVIQGHLDQRRLEQFAPLAATLLPTGETLLVGPVIDQAALHGLLTRIRDLGVPLLRLQRKPDTDEEAPNA